MRPHILHGGLHRMGDRLGHFIDEEHFLGRDPLDDLWMTKTSRPLTNIRKEQEAYVLELALPGYTKEEVMVEMKDDTITIQAEKKTPVEESVTHKQEFGTPSFHQSFHLPAQINQDKVEAKLEHGVLHVRLPIKENVALRIVPVT